MINQKITGFLNKWGKNKTILYMIINYIGLIGVARFLTVLLSSLMLNTIEIYGWVYPYFINEDKPVEILFYVVGVLLIFSYSVLLIFLNSIEKLFTTLSSSWKFYLVYLLIQILFYKLSSIIINTYLIVLLIVAWIGFFLFYNRIYGFIADIFSKRRWTFTPSIVIQSKSIYSIAYIAFFLGITQFFFIFYPFVFQKVHLINEFYNIPEETIISGRITDNTAYINAFKNKLNYKYDVREKPGTSTYSDRLCGKQLFADDSAVVHPFAKTTVNDKYKNKRITVINNTGIESYNILANVAFENIGVFNRIGSCIDAGWVNNYWKEHDSEEFEFLEKNRYEMHWQILSRGILHHHNHIYGPINEISLGKDPGQVIMQYGAFITNTLRRIMEYCGGLSISRYFKVFFSFYYAYYLMFLLFLIYCFKDIKIISIVSLLSFACLNYIGFHYIFLGPGTNPIRHFLDLIVILFVILSIRKNNNWYLTGALLFSIASVLVYNLYGLFLLVSLFAIVIIKMITGEYRNKIERVFFPALLFLSLGAVLHYLLTQPAGHVDRYFFYGFIGFHFSQYTALAVFSALIVSYLMLFINWRSMTKNKYVSLFMVIYSQGLLLYYVVITVNDHILSFMPIYLLTGFVLINQFFEINNITTEYRNPILAIILIASMIIFTHSTYYYYKTKNDYYSNFVNHRTHSWNSPRTGFISTMNPEIFQDSIELINKYSRNKGIYIISKYDIFLPFIAGKFSEMPFFDMQWNMIGHKDFEKVVNYLNEKRPEHIFIDSDFQRMLTSDIINKN